jgi:hypothetical protein
MKSAQAYYETALITTVKSFITLTPCLTEYFFYSLQKGAYQKTIEIFSQFFFATKITSHAEGYYLQ